MSLRSIDAALDRLYLALNGSTRERHGNAEAAAMAVALALAAIAFGFELTNPTLGVDDFTYLDIPFTWDPFWIGRGSWGGLLVQYLTPGGWMTPFVSLVIGILLQLLTAVLIGWALGVRALSPLQQALLYALFVAFPYFACQMAFNYVQIAYPLASLLMACGVLLTLAGGTGRSVCAAIAIAFAISIYQGSLSVLAPVALLAPLAVAEPRGRAIVGRYGRVLIAVLAGGALYFAAHKSILAITGVVAQNPYYSVSFDWRFWERLASIRGETAFLLLGASDVIPAKAVVIWVLAALLLLLHEVGRQRGALQRLRWLGLCVPARVPGGAIAVPGALLPRGPACPAQLGRRGRRLVCPVRGDARRTFRRDPEGGHGMPGRSGSLLRVSGQPDVLFAASGHTGGHHHDGAHRRAHRSAGGAQRCGTDGRRGDRPVHPPAVQRARRTSTATCSGIRNSSGRPWKPAGTCADWRGRSASITMPGTTRRSWGRISGVPALLAGPAALATRKLGVRARRVRRRVAWAAQGGHSTVPAAAIVQVSHPGMEGRMTRPSSAACITPAWCRHVRHFLRG